MPLFSNVLAGAAGQGSADAYTIKQSLRFPSEESAYLTKNIASGGNKKTWTWSAWFKRGHLSDATLFGAYFGNSSRYFLARFRGNRTLDVFGGKYTTGGSTTTCVNLRSEQVFADPQAWTHIMFVQDTTQGVASDRFKVYVNGIKIEDYSTETYPDYNDEGFINAANATHYIGQYGENTNYWDGMIADVQFVDGLALSPSDLGASRATDGVWMPTAYSGNYTTSNGSNGYRLNFSNSNTFTAPPSLYSTSSGGNTPPSNASSLTYSAGNYLRTNGGVTYDAGSVRKFWIQPGSADPSVYTSDNGTSWTTIFDGSVTWNNPIEVHCRYVYMSSSGSDFGVYYSQPAFTADASGNDNHWRPVSLTATAPAAPATTSHRYWRVVIYNHNGSHWPRMSKLYMYEADGTRRTHKNYTSDNCSDQGSIPSNGGTYDADYTNSYNFVNVGIYSTYNGGGRVGRAEVYYSDNNSDWTYSFESIVHNNNSCGEQKGVVDGTEVVDVLLDSPTDYEADGTNNGGNYCTLNILNDRYDIGTSGTRTFQQGNLKVTASTGDNTRARYLSGTIGVSSGKWYYEMTAVGQYGGMSVGFAPRERQDDDSSVECRYTSNGTIQINGTTHSSLAQYVHNDLIGVALDLTNNTVQFYKNGSTVGSAYSITSNVTYYPLIILPATGTTTTTALFNFGAVGSFRYTPPTGHLSLCTTNLPDPVIPDGSAHFDASLWTGNGNQIRIGERIYSANATATGGFEASNPAANGFNGTLTAGNRANGQTLGGTIEITFSPGLPVSSNVGIWSGKSGFKYQINNSGSYTSVTNSVEQWHDASFSGTLTNLKIQHTASNEAPGFSGIRVDGATLIDGNGAPLEFAPDLAWIKSRGTGNYHMLFDTVRGVEKRLHANTNTQEQFGNNDLTAFNSDGYTLDDNTSPTNSDVNNDGTSYIGWNWNAGANSDKTYSVKVVSDNGNKFRFSSNGNDYFGTSGVTLDLAEGSTYVFDQSDSSNAGHPLRFGTSSNGTDYTTGVTHTGTPGQAGAKTTLVLGTGVSTLHYSCLNHSGMGGQINTNSTEGCSNFDGALQAVVKANPLAGFSIVRVPGPSSAGFQKVGHGLQSKPKLIICKDLSNARNWGVYHEEAIISDVRILILNNTSGTFNSSTAAWDISQIDSSTFTPYFRDDFGCSYNANNVALCFAPVIGFSSIGTYKATGISDGTYVACGFKPALVVTKRIDASGAWEVHTYVTPGYNSHDNRLIWSDAGAEVTGNDVDFLADGFKIRNTFSGMNSSQGGTYLYYAVAQLPFKAARAA